MEFSYTSYINFIELIEEMNYKIVSYDDSFQYDRCIILRHDVDYSLDSAYKLAQIEYELGIKTTYFFLLTSDLYNVFSLNGMKTIESILSCGHEIGLHFDEIRYPDILSNADNVKNKIIEETSILAKAVGRPITKVSMHRPSSRILEANLKVPGIINTYCETFFKEFKYISDSRCVWREPIEYILKNRLYHKLQILIHPFWYHDEDKSIDKTIKCFINNANIERYQIMDKNISNLSKVMRKDEISC